LLKYRVNNKFSTDQNSVRASISIYLFMRTIQRIILVLFLLLSSKIVFSQEPSAIKSEQFRIMFYNVENLFDPFDDTLKNDEEFVSGGISGWNWKKFERKLVNISKVIVATGCWEPPEIVAFSEVENTFVLIQLLKRTPLNRFGYNIIHEESPDERGIDVGLIYRREKFKELFHKTIPVRSDEKNLTSRDILYVKGILNESSGKGDTLHIFVNHWPSRTGGPAITAYKREVAALILKKSVDSLFRINPSLKIVITGDFNDEPIDESIKTYLGANTSTGNESGSLYNLMSPFVGKFDTGTNKFRNQWGVIDQFIVSGVLLNDNSSLMVKNKEARIINFPFLLKTDEKFQGTVPFRTFNGMKYIGGFSDHLPVLLTLELKD